MVKRFVVSFVALGALLGSMVGAQPVQAAGSVPVLIVGGLVEPQFFLNTLQSSLQSRGFTVFTMALPGALAGTQDIGVSAQAVAAEARQVLARTGSKQLDVVGHSEGGLALRFFIKNLGGAALVRRYVSLGTPQHGTQLANIIGAIPILGNLAGAICTACTEMAVGSTFLTTLNSPTDVPGAVSYTALGTTHDELVIPAPQASFLRNGGTSAAVQQFNPADATLHVGLLFDPTTAALTASALRGGPLSAS